MSYIVYKHTCPNNLIYIGITRQEPERRWRGGFHYEYNRRFFMAIAKYGWDNIRHDILDSGLTYEQAKKKESEYIERFKSADEHFGYNQTLGVGGIGFTKTLETRQKLSAAHRGKKLSAEHCRKISEAQKGKHMGKDSRSAKKVYQYDLEGNFIKEWACQSDAARFYHCNQSKISECAAGKKKQIKGFIWRNERV